MHVTLSGTSRSSGFCSRTFKISTTFGARNNREEKILLRIHNATQTRKQRNEPKLPQIHSIENCEQVLHVNFSYTHTFLFARHKVHSEAVGVVGVARKHHDALRNLVAEQPVLHCDEFRVWMIFVTRAARHNQASRLMKLTILVSVVSLRTNTRKQSQKWRASSQCQQSNRKNNQKTRRRDFENYTIYLLAIYQLTSLNEHKTIECPLQHSSVLGV